MNTISTITPFLRLFQFNKSGLLIIPLVIFSLSLTACQSDPPEVDPQFVSPVSPLSSPANPEPSITEVNISELDLGGCLLFSSNRSGDFEIYQRQPESDGLQPLTGSPGLDIEPAWSPDGTQITFASNREGEGFQIYKMNVDGSDQQRLGPVQPGENNHPSWSPDGTQIVFQSKRDINADPLDDNFDIYIMDGDGTNTRLVAGNGADDTAPRWSPDGTQIAFLSERSGQDEIYVMDADGTNVKQLTELAVLKSGLSWSPDGQQIVFEGGGDLYTVDLETQELIRLTVFEDVNGATPAWVKEGLIIFSSDRSGNWDLYMLDKTTPSELKLAQITDDSGIDRSPAWFACDE